MKKTLLFLSAFTCAISSTNAQNCADLFISEYVEGWSNNKALEIYNPTASTINLNNYIVARASNGASLSSVQVKYAVQLTGTIAPYSTHVGVVGLTDPAGSGQTAPIWDSLEVKADAFYSPVYNTNSCWHWNGNDAILLLKGTLSGGPTTTLVSISPALSIVDIFGKIGENPGDGWTSVSPYVGTGDMVTEDHSLIRKATILKGVTNDAIALFNPLAEYDSIPAVTYVEDENGDIITNNDLSPKLFGNWFSLGEHDCDCAPAVLGVKEVPQEVVSIFPNPSNGTVYVKGITEFELIEVINTLGQKVQTIENNSKSIVSIDLNNNKGIYLVRLTNINGNQVVKRVIVK